MPNVPSPSVRRISSKKNFQYESKSDQKTYIDDEEHRLKQMKYDLILTKAKDSFEFFYLEHKSNDLRHHHEYSHDPNHSVHVDSKQRKEKKKR